MKHKQFIKEYATRLAFLCATLAIFLFIPMGLTQSIGLRVLFGILILLLLTGGGVLLYLSAKEKGAAVHYFLYDRRRKIMRAREQLNAEIIFDTMDYYLRPFGKAATELWSDLPKPLRLQLDAEPHFKPLVAYRMLYALSALSGQDATALFAAADNRVVSYLCRTLAECGEQELADFIYQMKKNAEKQSEHIGSFFQKNAKFFAARAERYIEQHFEDFTVEKSKFEK